MPSKIGVQPCLPFQSLLLGSIAEEAAGSLTRLDESDQHAMDKVVILAAGRGTRMQQRDETSLLAERQSAAADSGVKALIPIDRPFLDYVLTAVADAGFRRVCLITGPQHEELRKYYSERSGGRLVFEFAVQPEPLGTAHALLSAAEFVQHEPFAVINSDNFYPSSALESLRHLGGSGLIAFPVDSLVRRGNIEPARANSFAIVEMDSGGYLKRIIEKPSSRLPPGHDSLRLVSMNCWRFGPTILPACRCIDRSSRNEYEMADAVSYSMHKLGERYRVIVSQEAVLDLSFRKDVQTVADKLRGMEVRL